MIIYGRTSSSNVRKVLWLADELGLRYERRDYGRGFAPVDTPEFRALNPNAKIPVIDDEGFIVWESHAILRYLAAKHGPDWYPGDLHERAIVDQWLDWVMSAFQEPVRKLFFSLHVNPGSNPEQVPQAETDSAALAAILDAQVRNAGAYITGPQPTIADCAAGMMVHRWYALDLARPRLPALEGYYERLKQRPAFQSAIVSAGV